MTMKLVKRFLVPSVAVTGYYWLKYGCMVSPRAEVDWSANLDIGKGTQVASFVKIKASDGPLRIGRHASVGSNVFISSHSGGVTIGDYCMISPNVSIIGNNYRYDDLDTPICMQEKTSKGITIGDNVWIGAGAVVLDGSKIGSGSIVGPNSVVSGVLPENSIAQGNPAKVIFTRR
jgi:acetyltransferase-like isoleucine patch superfamily enzyme